MYKFRYGFMKDNVNIFQLMYSATDSFIFETIGENFNELMQKHNDFFYLSYFPKGSQYFCNDNKKVPGKVKDEYGGKIIYETTILRSKNYSIRTVWIKMKKSYTKVIIHLLDMMNMKIHALIKKLLTIQ